MSVTRRDGLDRMGARMGLRRRGTRRGEAEVRATQLEDTLRDRCRVVELEVDVYLRRDMRDPASVAARHSNVGRECRRGVRPKETLVELPAARRGRERRSQGATAPASPDRAGYGRKRVADRCLRTPDGRRTLRGGWHRGPPPARRWLRDHRRGCRGASAVGRRGVRPAWPRIVGPSLVEHESRDVPRIEMEEIVVDFFQRATVLVPRALQEGDLGDPLRGTTLE